MRARRLFENTGFKRGLKAREALGLGLEEKIKKIVNSPDRKTALGMHHLSSVDLSDRDGVLKILSLQEDFDLFEYYLDKYFNDWGSETLNFIWSFAVKNSWNLTRLDDEYWKKVMQKLLNHPNLNGPEAAWTWKEKSIDEILDTKGWISLPGVWNDWRKFWEFIFNHPKINPYIHPRVRKRFKKAFKGGLNMKSQYSYSSTGPMTVRDYLLHNA